MMMEISSLLPPVMELLLKWTFFLLSENIQLYMHRRLGGREPNFDTNVVFGLLRLFFLCIIRQILNINFM